MNERTIQRIPMPDLGAFYGKVVAMGEPVIITGLTDAWPARKKWSFDWFVDTYGDEQIPVEWLTYVRAARGDSAARQGRREAMPLRSYIETLADARGKEGGYLIGTDMFDRLPKLLEDLQFPRVQPNDKMTKRLFFMGSKGGYTQLHYDRADNLHTMIRGSKRWQLFSPARTAALDPVEPGFVWSVMSGLDLGHSTMRPLHELGPVELDYDLVLEEGETLYLPYGWWHRVVSESATISTNLWWWTYGMLARLAPSLAPSAVRIAYRKFRERNASTPARA